jgi:hypothetical protein
VSVINRRNAVLGWLTLQLAKRQWVREKILRRTPPPPPPTVVQRARNPKALAAILAAAGGVLAFLRLRKGGDEA